jgi:hypothetical protein
MDQVLYSCWPVGFSPTQFTAGFCLQKPVQTKDITFLTKALICLQGFPFDA